MTIPAFTFTFTFTFTLQWTPDIPQWDETLHFQHCSQSA